MYSCLNASKLPPSDSKSATVTELQAGQWYKPYQPTFEKYLLWAEGEEIARCDGDGNWFTWSSKHNEFRPASVKVEYQRQCMFWRDGRPEANPLRLVQRTRHYALYYLTADMRYKMTASELSHVLTNAEGSLVVQDLLPRLTRLGSIARTNNDGIIVPESDAATTLELMRRVAFEHLGFIPHVSVK